MYQKLVTRAVEKELCRLAIDENDEVNVDKQGYRGHRGQCMNKYKSSTYLGDPLPNSCITDWDCGYFQLGEIAVGEPGDSCMIKQDDNHDVVPCVNCRYGYSYEKEKCCEKEDECIHGLAAGDSCDPVAVYKETGAESPNWCGYCPYSFYRDNNASQTSAWCCEKEEGCIEGQNPVPFAWMNSAHTVRGVG